MPVRPDPRARLARVGLDRQDLRVPARRVRLVRLARAALVRLDRPESAVQLDCPVRLVLLELRASPDRLELKVFSDRLAHLDRPVPPASV